MSQYLEVKTITSEGQADVHGIRVGDIILTANGKSVSNNDELGAALSSTSQHALVIERKGKQIDVGPIEGKLGLSAHEINEKDRQVGLMQITSAPSLEGYRIVETVDVISSEHVYGLNIIKSMFADVVNFVGGRSGTAQNVLRNARLTCMRELRREAISVGANAVIGVSLNYSEFSGEGKSMLFLVASGTAVVVEPIS